MALLRVENISKQLGRNMLVDDISFEQQVLQKMAITGESGAGKTTLLKMISGYIQPTGGHTLFDGNIVLGPDEKLLPGHKEIAYLSQHYELRNNYHVQELVAMENKVTGEEAAKLFEICRVSHLLHRRTDELSGGEKQRISLCILLIKRPRMIVLDEPFSNLDPIHTEILKDVLEEITGRLKVTCLLTSHDPHDTLSWADNILVMKEGKIVQQGSPQEIYYRPANEYVAGMFGKYNLLTPTQAALFGLDETGIIVRPESFIMNRIGNGVKAIIQRITFWGTFYEVDVLMGGMKIAIRMMNNECKAGQEVYLNISKEYL